MEETAKTYVFGEPSQGGGSLDPNLLLAMNNGGGGFGGGAWSNPLWALIFLAFLGRGFGFNGNEGCGGNAFVSSQLGQAIAGNANAISNLATSLNCTEGQIQAAIANLQSAIQQVANANNMNTMQVVNAVNTGNSSLASSIQTCCCNITNAVNTGFGNLRYEDAANTCAIKQNVADNTSRIIAKMDAIQDEAKNNKIAELTANLATVNARAERQAELAPLFKAINDIQCKLPQTYNVPYQPFTPIPNCVAYGMGLYGAGYGFNPGGSIWS